MLRRDHDRIDRRAALVQPVLQPCQKRGLGRISATQSLGDLRAEDVGGVGLGSAGNSSIGAMSLGGVHPHSKGFDQRKRARRAAKHLIHRLIRLQPQPLCRDDLRRQTPHVFNHHDAQGDRNRPKLADRQRLNRLISLHKPRQDRGREQAVGVGNIGPGQFQHTRISGKGTAEQFRQLVIIIGRQIGLDLPKLCIDSVEIVQQPFGGGGNGLPGLQR
ncbi:MAG: hypothetical protein ACD_54C00377G0003 [uncultured bacterium]|nr:MAG: hypothetical protein ACD_54C00377G0003 [uncultured bacterium]